MSLFPTYTDNYICMYQSFYDHYHNAFTSNGVLPLLSGTSALQLAFIRAFSISEFSDKIAL